MKRLAVIAAILSGALSILAAALVLTSAHAAAAKPGRVSVMTRNLYLGANLELGVNASSLQGLFDAAGRIIKQVDANKFQVRAKGLAAEILARNPDLVGLQEAALWRTGPCTSNPLALTASTVRYDYLALLLAQLNRGRTRYRVAISEPEFDFETYVNLDGNASTHAPGCSSGAELNGRLTMRDAILYRVGRVKVSNARGAHFKTLLQVSPGGVGLKIDVTRGWARVDASVAGRRFRFVDAHLEAFDNQVTNHTNTGLAVTNGRIREAQAKELRAPGGPATGKLPVVLVGDLNSDVRTPLKPGDSLADRALLRAGFAERSTSRNGCCLNADILTIRGGGRASDFDHRVDHVMTDQPRRIKLISSALTGGKPVNGFWDSDHQGLFSELAISAR